MVEAHPTRSAGRLGTDPRSAWQATPVRIGSVPAPGAGAPLRARIGRVRPLGADGTPGRAAAR